MDLIWNEPPNRKTNSLYLPSDTNQQYICARRGGGRGGGEGYCKYKDFHFLMLLGIYVESKVLLMMEMPWWS